MAVNHANHHVTERRGNQLFRNDEKIINKRSKKTPVE